MKLSGNQKNILKKINRFLLAGIPLTMLIPSDLSGQENRKNMTLGKPPSPKSLTKDSPQKQTWIYIVQQNDTMYGIAKKYKSTVKEICQLNGIPEKDAGKLKVGEKLLIPKRNRSNEQNTKPIRGEIKINKEKELNSSNNIPVGTIALPEK